ncbi:ComEC/Rec2 family competence protein [Halalkalibacter nanhaiisediminis]|uniref:Beta-lactamase superfamily II metal-dependent hydrolase n=1 Tax=Halalkalibacter nanhaiisediminis TaxID=688079 RepID=A0A562QRS8_9BACI|nr:hypothetical protein [Halalkalibacter nanhaiisediminis]TWI58900.1 beta-lactamase superfamily II metal-dependent hydrolase [Halalkalibacter nanhaiisediminis]
MRISLVGLVCFFVLATMLGCEVQEVMTTIEEEQAELHLQLDDDEIGFVFLDLPNGEATYIDIPEKESILIGTGAKDSWESLRLRLKKLAITSIDTIVLPRFESEYSANTEKLIAQYNVKTVVVPIQGQKQAQELLQKDNVEIISWKNDQSYELSDHFQVKTVSSEVSLIPMLSFMIMVHDTHSFFFAAEASETIEEKWLEKGLPAVEVLKVAEFGTGNGTTESFLSKIDPQVAILFSKQNAKPSSQLLERLQETWIDTYETSQNGSVIIKANKDDYQLVTVRFQDLDS